MGKGDTCALPKCKSMDIAVTYYGQPVCPRCWSKYSKNTDNLKRLLGISGEKKSKAVKTLTLFI